MSHPSGQADLPLHRGRVPRWLASRMERLGRVMVEALLLTYGRDEVLRRLSHPFWFQSLGAVMGMDWHSSGITTSVVGALKRGLAPVSEELGIYVCGGRGRYSRRTPGELLALADRLGLPGDDLVRKSRLVAKVDNAAIQDGFQIYLHTFILAANGAWTVVQQGMDAQRGQARRYHWLSEGLTSFIEAPHTGIDGPSRGTIVNLTDRRAAANRRGQLEIVQQGPDQALRLIRKETATLPHLVMPDHHEVRASNVVPRRLFGALKAAAESEPQDYETLLGTRGVGPRAVAALALVSEVLHGAPSRFTDPARFAMAHGGKDGHPFPVPVAVYDRTIGVLKNAVQAAKLGNDDKLFAIRRLDRQARQLERTGDDFDVEAFIKQERRLSSRYNGRTVHGPAPKPPDPLAVGSSGQQLNLPGLL